MASKIVNDRQRSTILAIKTQQSNLRVDRSDGGDLLIPGHGVSPTHIDLAAIFEDYSPVLADSLLPYGSGTNLNGSQRFNGFPHNLDDQLVRIAPHVSVAVASIDDQIFGCDSRVFRQFLSYRTQESVWDVADSTNGHRVNSY